MMNPRLPGVGLVLLLVLAGCAVHRPSPVAPPAPIPAVQRAAFEQGMKAFQDRDYEKAVRLFQDVIVRFPGSALLEETQWMIGKSRETNNDVDRAVNEYQSFLTNFPSSPHRYEATLRIDFLETILRRRTVQRSYTRHVGIRLQGDPEKAAARWETELSAVTVEGTRTVILPGYGANGVYFKTDQAPVLNETMAGAVKAAHARGLKLWVRLPARHLPWFKLPGEERDLRYDPVRKKLVPTAALDLFNPMTLDRLKRFYLDLAATGADGVVIDEAPFIDAWEGFSPAAQAAFLQNFGEPLDPGRLLLPSAGIGKADWTPESSGTPLFWQWAGWKNREMLDRLAELFASVRERYPGLDWIRILPPDAVTQPHMALARSGTDLLEEKQHGFDYFGIALSFDLKRDDPAAVLDHLIELIGDSKRVFVLVPWAEGGRAASRLNDFQGAGLLFSEAEKEPKAPLTRRHQ
jgi:hypothetical protein